MMIKLHTFFPFLKFMLAFLALNFAAGADVLGAAEGAEAFVDTGEEGGEGEGPGGASGAGEGEEAGEGEGTEEQRAAAAAGAAKAGEQTGPQLSKPLSKEAVTALKGLKEANPKAWKELNNRLWGGDGLFKKVEEHFGEGGLDAAVELKGNVDSFLENNRLRDLEEANSEIQDFRATDAKIIKGDISFINDLPENVRGGIDRMMPDFVGQWADRDKEGHDRYFGGLMVNTLRDTDFTMNLRTAIRELERMGLEDGDVKTVHDLLKANFDWIEKMKATAATPPKKKEGAGENDQQLNRREQSIKEKEIGLARQRIGANFRRHADPKMLATLKGIYQGKIPATINKGEVMLRALRDELGPMLGQQFEDKIRQYLEAGDEQGAIKYTLSQATDARLTEAVKKADRFLYPKAALGRRVNPGAGGGNNTRTAGGANSGAGAGKADNTFTKIAYNPRPSSIDYAATDKLAKELGMSRGRNQLFSQNKAVLKSGKKVTWTKDDPDES
jgi:hypothetical protein